MGVIQNGYLVSQITRQLITLFDPVGVDLRGVSLPLTERSLLLEIKLKEIQIFNN